MAPKKKDKPESSSLKQENVLKAVVVADSFNKRFYPISANHPRCLFPLANRPLISYTLEFLVSCNVKHVFVYCCHAANKIKEYLQSSKWMKQSSPCCLTVISSNGFTSVGDVLRDVDQKSLFENDFLLIQGDLVSNMQLKSALEEHKTRREKDKNGPLMTLVMCKASPTHGLRSVEENIAIAADCITNRLLHYHKVVDKKKINFPMSIFENSDCKVELRYDLVDCNIWLCSPQVPPLFTDNFDYQTHLDFIKGILINEEFLGNQIHMHVVKSKYCARMHNLHSYEIISKNVVSRWTYPFVPEYCYDDSDTRIGYSLFRHNVYLHNDCKLKHDAVVKDQSIVGQGSIIGSGCLIAKSIIGDKCVIEDGCIIDGCCIWNGVTVKKNSRIVRSVLCDNVTVFEGVQILQGCVLCDKVAVGPNVNIEKDTTVYIHEGNNVKTDTAVLGKNGFGVVWKSSSDSYEDDLVKSVWGLSLLDYNSQRENELSDEDSESGSDISSMADDELDKDDTDVQIVDDDLSRFQQEVKESLIGAIEEKIVCDNLALEINSSKYAYNMTVSDIVQTMTRSVLEIAMHQSSSQKDYFPNLKPILIYVSPLLSKYNTSTSLQLSCLFTIEEYAVLHEQVANCIIKVFMWLYENDIICEEVFLRWNTNPKHFVGCLTPNQIRQKVGKFIQWLVEAEEEESSEED